MCHTYSGDGVYTVPYGRNESGMFACLAVKSAVVATMHSYMNTNSPHHISYTIRIAEYLNFIEASRWSGC